MLSKRVSMSPSHGFAVLNAADPLVVSMAEHCQEIYFAYSPDNEVIQSTAAGGGPSSSARFRCATKAMSIPLVALAQVLTHGVRIRFQVENVLAAAAWPALGVPRDAIRTRSKRSRRTRRPPGWFNRRCHTMQVIDYGHNTSALAAILDAFQSFCGSPLACIVPLATVALRHDRAWLVLGDAFDGVILYESLCPRPDRGEITRLMRQGLAAGWGRIEEIATIAAVEHALKTVQPGELLLLQADEIDVTVDYTATPRRASDRAVRFARHRASAGVGRAVRHAGAGEMSRIATIAQPAAVLARDCVGSKWK
jgi:cyanophycin synthetase